MMQLIVDIKPPEIPVSSIDPDRQVSGMIRHDCLTEPLPLARTERGLGPGTTLVHALVALPRYLYL